MGKQRGTCRKKEKLWNDNIPEQLHARRYIRSPQYTIFFHPAYTVGPGITPGHAFRLVGYTTGGELHPALKILIQFTTVYYQRAPMSMPPVRFLNYNFVGRWIGLPGILHPVQRRGPQLPLQLF